MKLSCLPVLALGLDDDGVAMLQYQGGLSREGASDKSIPPSRRTQDLLQQGASVDGLTSDGVHEQLGQLNAAFEAAQAGEGPISAEALQDVFKSAAAQIESFLVQESADDQAIFDANIVKHSLCISHHDLRTATTGDLTLNTQALDAAKSKHESCRKSEKSWEDLKSAYECGHTGMSTAALHTSPKCPDAGVLQKRLDSDAKTYHDLPPVGKRATCSEEQILWETKFCEFRSAKVGTCTGLSECVSLLDLDNLKVTMGNRADHKREVWSEVEWLGCRISTLHSNQTDQTCKKEINATQFVMDLDIPPVPACSTDDVNVFPEDEACDDFRQLEYNWNGDHVVPSQCEVTCPAINTNKIAVAEGCTDSPGDCSLYDHHQDACGKYDNSSFVASEVCCNCGKPAGPPPGTDLGCGHPTTASSIGGWGTVKVVNDCVIDETHGAHHQTGHLTHTNHEHNAWIEVDFEEEQRMQSVKIWNGWQWGCCMSRINPYRLIFLDANRNEVKRVTGLHAKTSGDGETETKLAESVKAQYVRVQLDDHTEYLHLAELRAYA